jgi:hypothetical protein
MVLSAVCISPKTPEAVATSRTMPTSVAAVPAAGSVELARRDLTRSAPWPPTRSFNSAEIAARTESSPKATPAMAVMISSTGASEVTA